MKKLFTVLVVVMLGVIALGMSIDAHEAEVLSAKEATFCANARLYAEWRLDEAPRRRARALAYVYAGEENASEIAEARAQIEESHAAWEAYYEGKSSYEEANDASRMAIWKAGKALVAWADRTGRCPVDFGEGVMFCYLTYEADGVTDRAERLRLARGEEVARHEVLVRSLFKFL